MRLFHKTVLIKVTERAYYTLNTCTPHPTWSTWLHIPIPSTADDNEECAQQIFEHHNTQIDGSTNWQLVMLCRIHHQFVSISVAVNPQDRLKIIMLLLYNIMFLFWRRKWATTKHIFHIFWRLFWLWEYRIFHVLYINICHSTDDHEFKWLYSLGIQGWAYYYCISFTSNLVSN